MNRALEQLVVVEAESVRGLAAALSDLSDLTHTAAHDPETVAEIAAQLDAAGVRALECLEAIPVGELRPRAASAARITRDDLLALLDLILEDEEGLSARIEAVAFLVTWLSTDVRGQERIVTRDPLELSSRIRELASRQAGGPSAAAVERELLDAATRLDAEPPEVVAETAAALKARVGAGLLAPTTLRALVFYEAREWTCRHDVSERPPPPRPRPVSAPKAAPRPIVAHPEPVTPPPAEPVSPAPPAAPVTPAAPVARVAPLPPEPAAWKLDAEAPRAEPPPKAPRRFRLRRILGAATVASLVGSAVWVWTAGPPGDVHVLGGRELAVLSPWLVGGYRSRAGQGPLFIGTFDASWQELAPELQHESGQDLVERLEADGVSQILVYDHRRRLALPGAQADAFDPVR